jgi:hypothetical protein
LLQTSEYFVVLVGDTELVPLVAMAPNQPPLPTQEVAFVLVQVSVAAPPSGMVDGLALKEMVGAGGGVPPA